jgi:hypothetical protein
MTHDIEIDPEQRITLADRIRRADERDPGEQIDPEPRIITGLRWRLWQLALGATRSLGEGRGGP